MIGAALALIVLGVIFFFIVPFVGIAAGIVGVILLVLFLAGFGRRAAESYRLAPPDGTTLPA
jgi:membrane-bound ClpP family serine protease